jgi:predicted nucleic acid-binding protein
MIVFDANVAVKTYVVEAGPKAATELLSGPSTFLAPELIRMEVCGALCRRVRLGQLTPQEAKIRTSHWLSQLQHGLVRLVPHQELLQDGIELSCKLKHAKPPAPARQELPLASSNLRTDEVASGRSTRAFRQTLSRGTPTPAQRSPLSEAATGSSNRQHTAWPTDPTSFAGQ